MKPRIIRIVCIALAIMCTMAFSAFAIDVPHTMSYQGKLTDKQGYALDGTYNVTFRLYDAATNGNLLWQETHTAVSVIKGLFSVILGSVTPLDLPFDKQYYLGIQVGSDTEMAPRQQLASAPYAFASESGVPTGSLMIWPTDTAPNGWLICDGSAVSRTTYAILFAVIGTTYGVGDGSATFNLPNLKGKVAVGKNGADAEFDTLGEMGGEKTHKLTITEMPSHTHSCGLQSGTADGGYGASCTSGTSGPTGGDAPHNNLQPYTTLNYIIKS